MGLFHSTNEWVCVGPICSWMYGYCLNIYIYTVVTTTSAACAITYHSCNCYGYQYRCFQIDLPFDFDSV